MFYGESKVPVYLLLGRVGFLAASYWKVSGVPKPFLIQQIILIIKEIIKTTIVAIIKKRQRP